MVLFRSVDRFLTRLHNYFFETTVSGKEKLRQNDILRLYVLTSLKRDGKKAADFFSRIMDGSESIDRVTQKKFEEFLPSSEEQKEILDRNVWEQVLNILSALDICARKQPYLPYGSLALLEKPRFPESLPDPSDLISFANRVRAGQLNARSGELISLSSSNKELQTVDRQILQNDKRIKHYVPTERDYEEISRRIENELGFMVYKATSTIPDAGQGLFIKGQCTVGSVVALYPGIVYFPSEWEKLPGYPYVSKYNVHLVKRQDGVIIDGKPYDDQTQVFQGQRPEIAWERINPFALGQYANHPPKGTEPNIIALSFDYPLYRMSPAMKVLVPNRYLIDEEEQEKEWSSNISKLEDAMHFGKDRKSRVMRGMVIITLRDVENEELFINYRYNPFASHPEWYWDPSPEETQWLIEDRQKGERTNFFS
ncbi:hypothetical protein GpartN1_g6282.t1 [Galdieria partita]|uniref:SET domain-containing protein n=1 Tax=Galdieria partita TaxID=83374 RepID=A0A9C7Q2X3_9RHOD|nr:hypothetical protein GpartN1_g6282.t1 [Galdieria partita]